MSWLTWKFGGIAVGGVIVLLLGYSWWSKSSENDNLKKQLSDAKQQVETINQSFQTRFDQFDKELKSQQTQANAQIALLQTQLNANNAIRAAAASTYQQQHQQTQSQLGRIATAPTTGLVQTLSTELKLPQDTFSVLPDRVQVGNDSFRSITQKVLECKDVTSQNNYLEVQVATLQKDKDSQAVTIKTQNDQINTLIADGQALRADMAKKLEELNKANAAQLKLKDDAYAELQKKYKNEHSFFGNVKKDLSWLASGIIVGASLGALAGI